MLNATPVVVAGVVGLDEGVPQSADTFDEQDGSYGTVSAMVGAEVLGNDRSSDIGRHRVLLLVEDGARCWSQVLRRRSHMALVRRTFYAVAVVAIVVVAVVFAFSATSAALPT